MNDEKITIDKAEYEDLKFKLAGYKDRSAKLSGELWQIKRELDQLKAEVIAEKQDTKRHFAIGASFVFIGFGMMTASITAMIAAVCLVLIMWATLHVTGQISTEQGGRDDE